MKTFYMKVISAFLSLLLALGAAGQNNDDQELLRVLDRQAAAWNRGDIESFMDTYWKSDSLMFIGKRGVTYGWKNTLNNYRESYPDTAAMGKLDFRVIHIRKLPGEYRYLTGKWHLARTKGDLEGFFTLLLRKMDNHWLIIADHSS